MSSEIFHDIDQQRYVLSINGVTASVLDYRDSPTNRAIIHTFTNPPFRGTGLAGRLIERAADDIERDGAGRKIVPTCWYAAEWFTRHPDRAHLVADR